MPKYYHDKIYSEEEREKLWIIKQERGYRYIGGEKCSTEDLEEENDMCRYAVRHWLELIRKRTGKSVKHWVITEKGEDYNRIHMHGIVWCRKEDVDAWRYGYTYIGDYVNGKTINYITKYMLQINENCPAFEGKVFCSQGIGRS